MSVGREIAAAKLGSLAYAAAGLGVGALWLAYAIVSPLPPQIDLVTAAFLAVIGWLMFKARRVRAPRVAVIWLRRFHVEAPPRYPFQKLMERLSDHGVIACTLRDSKVHTSDYTIRAFKRDNMPEFNRRAHRSMNWWGLRVAIAGTVLFLVLLLSGMVLVPRLGVSPQIAGVLTLTSGVATFLVLTVLHLVRERRIWNEMLSAHMDSVRIEEHELRDIDEIMQKIATGRGLRAGAYVFDVVDAVWKKAGASISSRAEAALFDVSELTQNLRYELEVLAARFPVEAVVIAWAMPDVQDPPQPSPEIVAELERAFGSGAWPKFKKLPYREQVVGLERVLAPGADAPHARELLYDAINAGRSRSAGAASR